MVDITLRVQFSPGQLGLPSGGEVLTHQVCALSRGYFMRSSKLGSIVCTRPRASSLLTAWHTLDQAGHAFARTQTVALCYEHY